MNMLRPSMASMLKPGENCYAFVVAVAKHARELAKEDEEGSISLLDEKPVKQSVEDFASGRVRMGKVRQEVRDHLV